jgi:hypothetical protein
MRLVCIRVYPCPFVVEKFTAALVGAIPNSVQNYQCNFSGDAV